MTAAGFRRIALALEGVVEGGHHGHADFRVGGRIFATLGYPDKSHGMVKLTPEQQRAQLRNKPEVFVPVNGKWGEGGATLVRLRVTDEDTLGEALTLAWQNAVTRRRAQTANKSPRRSKLRRRSE
jgi:hypothetical protein